MRGVIASVGLVDHVLGVPKKRSSKVVCLVLLYPNMRFVFGSNGTFLWDRETFFLGHPINPGYTAKLLILTRA